MGVEIEKRLPVETCGDVVRFAVDVNGPITGPVVVNAAESVETEPIEGWRGFMAGQRYKVTIEPVEPS